MNIRIQAATVCSKSQSLSILRVLMNLILFGKMIRKLISFMAEYFGCFSKIYLPLLKCDKTQQLNDFFKGMKLFHNNYMKLSKIMYTFYLTNINVMISKCKRNFLLFQIFTKYLPIKANQLN